MATRLYPIPNTLDANVPAITPAYDSLWRKTGSAIRRFLGSKTSGTTYYYEIPTETRSYNGVDPIGNLLLAQLISRPLKAQTISGTFKGAYLARLSSSYSGIAPQLTIKVVSQDGSVTRGYLYASQEIISNMNLTISGYYDASYVQPAWMQPTSTGLPIDLDPVTCQDGDRIVIETGGYDFFASAGDTSFFVSLANNNTNSYNDVNPDIYSNYFSVYWQSPAMWMEFSQDIEFFGALDGEISQTVNLSATLAPRQLASNGTFETTAGAFTSTGWSNGTNSTIGASALGAGYNGSNYALRILRSNATLGNAWASVTVSSLVSGQKYRVDCWVKKSAGVADPQVDIQVGTLATSATYTATDTWQKMSRVFTAAATSYVFYVRLGQTVAESGSAVLIDNFSVIKYTVFEPLYSRDLLQADVSMGATGMDVQDLRDFMGDATSDMADVTMSATATIADSVFIEGSLDANVVLEVSQPVTVDAFLSGEIPADVAIGGTAIVVQEMPVASAAANLVGTQSPAMDSYSQIELNPISMKIDVSATNRVRLPIRLPPDPEPATPGTPAVAQGVPVRALHGVIVDMPNPTIVNGKPT